MAKKKCVHKDVFNGVCGKCLMPVEGVQHDDKGTLIEDKRTGKARTREAMAAMDGDGFGLDGPDFVPMEEQKRRYMLSKSTKITKRPVTSVKKAAAEVMKRHKDLFKKLAPRDMVYNLDFDGMIVLAEVTHLLTMFFSTDYVKITAWLTFENLNLGGVTPIKMIQLGRGKKLISYIKTSFDENGM